MYKKMIDSNPKQTELDCQNVSDDEARIMIVEYMKKRGQAWPQDISLKLQLDFGQVMRNTHRLLDEGILDHPN
ncbi:MAG: hypothetical protein ACTSSE_12285 [Candidatus Thorarchaeota archaeon]